jgi:hypothetical protein
MTRIFPTALPATTASVVIGMTLAGLLAGCATLTESTQQQVLVQTIQDNREVFNVGCVLSNDVGKWFVTAPGRIVIQKSRAPLRIDCKKTGVAAYEKIDSKNGSLWGNVVFTAGVGYLIDRDTGAAYNYPSTLTIEMRATEPPPGDVPAGGVTVY